MKKFGTRSLAWTLALGMLAPQIATAQTPVEPATPESVAPELEAAYYGIPAELDDPAFGMYVDISLLQSAWDAKDAELLTDLALQLAQGERVLLRSHKAGSSKDLLSLATRVAQNGDDKAALDRIAQAATLFKFDDVVALAKSSNKLAGASRRDEPALNVSIDQTSPAAFADYSAAVRELRNAELLGSKDLLKGLNDWVETAPGLTDQQKEYIRNRTREVENQPEDPILKDNRIASTISKLEGDSRHGGHGPSGGGGGGRRISDAEKAAMIMGGIGALIHGPGGHPHGGGGHYPHGGGHYPHGGGHYPHGVHRPHGGGGHYPHGVHRPHGGGGHYPGYRPGGHHHHGYPRW